jgi:type 1 glutamine amidotransferase
MIDTFVTTDKIKTAVITGNHPYDVPAFHDMWRSFPEILFYPQTLEDFVADAGAVRNQYDVLVFYNFHQEVPDPTKGGLAKATYDVINHLGDRPQGILILHHAIVAWTEWPLWGNIIGNIKRNHGYAHDQELHVQIANHEHPITKALADWDVVDETYPLDDAKPVDGNNILLTVDHPNSMHTLAWTRQYRNARLFCWQSGHDHIAFSNPTYRTILSRGVQWLAGKP